MSLPLEPHEVYTLINAMERAREVHGEQPPSASVTREAIARAAELDLDLTFHRVLGEEGMVWEVRLVTQRGVVKRTPDTEADETWESVLDELLGA